MSKTELNDLRTSSELLAELRRLSEANATLKSELAVSRAEVRGHQALNQRLAAEVKALRKLLTELRVWFSTDTMIGKANLAKINAALAARPGGGG